MNTDEIDFDALGMQAQRLRITDKAGAGAILARVRAHILANPGISPIWSHWMQKHHFDWAQMRRCVHEYSPEIEIKLFPRIAKPTRREPTPVVPVVTVPLGEVHEAARGFKAMMNKAAAEEDIAQSRRRRTVAFQHFKFLLGHSNLPDLMKMSPDEIIELVRKI